MNKPAERLECCPFLQRLHLSRQIFSAIKKFIVIICMHGMKSVKQKHNIYRCVTLDVRGNASSHILYATRPILGFQASWIKKWPGLLSKCSFVDAYLRHKTLPLPLARAYSFSQSPGLCQHQTLWKKIRSCSENFTEYRNIFV